MPIIYYNNAFGQPPQAIPSTEKDEFWGKLNMDWIEEFLRAQLPEKRKRLIKNYNVAQGVIDIEDYVKVADNEYKELYDKVESETQDSLFQDNEVVAEDLHFYPIVPAIINVLTGELMKRFDHIKIKAVDQYSTNENLEYKKQLVLQNFRERVQQKIQENLQGMDENSQEYQQQAQQLEQKYMSLPEIQHFMENTYQNLYEVWANRIIEQANYKYRIPEKEPEIFKHQLIADEAYWHLDIKDGEMDIDVWNPMETIVLKTKHNKYTTNADMVATQYKTTVSNIIAKWKNKIDKDIVEKFDSTLGVRSYLGESRRSPDDYESWGQQERKLIAIKNLIKDLEVSPTTEVLVTEGYWMSQRRLAHVTAVYDGVPVEKITDDTFVQTIKPVYDKDKNLVSGEEVEYFYSPHVWHGVKINFGNTSGAGTVSSGGIFDQNKYLDESIKGKPGKPTVADDIEKGLLYIDVQPTEYQFTDSINPFRPKIPVVGCDGFEPTMNVGNLALVDKTKSYQILYNSGMNQIDNFMRTEVGLFHIIDQKLFPRKSLNGSWGKNNYVKFILTANETGLGVVDNSVENTGSQGIMQQPTTVDILKDRQFKSRLELCSAFKAMLFETIGITPQRLGTIASQETATGVNQAIQNSYAQTEIYFQNHTNLMKELKEMILDAEKYLESKKPVSRVQYLNSDLQNILFEVDTEDLLLRRFNLFVTSNPDEQRVLQQMQQLAIQNNTAGATMYDLAEVIESNNTRHIKDVLKQSVINMQEAERAKREHERQLQQEALQAKEQADERQRQFEAEQNERNRLTQMYVADVRAAGMAKDNDIDSNLIPDPLEVAKFNLEQGKYYSDILDKEQLRVAKERESADKINLEKLKVAQKDKEIKSKEILEKERMKVDLMNQKNDLQIARENAKGRGTKSK